MKAISLSTHLFPFHPLNERNLYIVKRFGFDCIEVWGMKPHFDYGNEGFIEKLKRTLKKLELTAKSLHLPFYEFVTSDPDKRGRFYISDSDESRRRFAVMEILRAMEKGKEIGAEIMVLHTGMEYPNSSFESLKKSISEILKKADELKVKIAIENGFRERTRLTDALNILKEFKEWNLGLCIDIGHLNISKEWEVFEEIDPEIIFEFHLADNNGEEDIHLLPYKGTCPMERIYEKVWKGNSLLVLEVGPVKEGEDIRREVLLSGKCAGGLSSAINMGEKNFKSLKKDVEGSILDKTYQNLLSFIPMKGDASIRTYARAITNSKSFVVMRIPRESGMEEKIETQNPQRMLNSFLDIHSFLKRNEIPVPEILIEDKERNLFFLEDEGDFILEDLTLLSEKRMEEFYRKAIELLVKIQNLKGDCIAFRRNFSRETLRWEMDHFVQYGLKGMECPESVIDELYYICDEISSFNYLFCHRDYHSKNIIVKGDDIYLVDFQDALMGPPHYDIASIVFDSYTEFEEDFEKFLINFYYELAMKGGIIKEDRETFLRHLSVTGLHRNLKAFGRFVFINDEKKNPYFLRFLLPTINKAIRNAKNIGLKNTLSILEKRREKFDG
jgi:aminoglycoside/choline kinase family phosphotransferase/sugar phosphate isomerase/epimerase